MVSWRSILRGAVTRFIPGVCAWFGVAWIITASRNEITVATTMVARVASLTLWFTLGYIVILAIIRARLHESARVHGRRSFIAGVATVTAVLAVQILTGAEMWRERMWALATIAGAVTTLSVFFPRLRSRMAHLERAENGQLYADVVEFAERGTPRDNTSVRATRTT